MFGRKDDNESNRRARGNRDRAASQQGTVYGPGPIPGTITSSHTYNTRLPSPSVSNWNQLQQITASDVQKMNRSGPAKLDDPTKARDLPVREQEDAIPAWKQAHLDLTRDKWTLHPLNMGSLDALPIEGFAKCYVHGEHKPPMETCTCGFYGYKTRELLEERSNGSYLPVLEVDFRGRIIVCEKGYRAEHQTILCVHLPGWCNVCGQSATTIIRNPYNLKDLAVISRCAEHIRPDEFQIRPEIIAESLSTEVKFG